MVILPSPKPLKLNRAEAAKLLLKKAALYNDPQFIKSDPIQIPHRFDKKEDIEISAFFSAVIAWGQRITIINNANRLMAWMDEAPHDFILNFQEKDLKPFTHFAHRTFNGDDALAFLHALQRIYREEGGLEKVLHYSFRDEAKSSGSGWHHFKDRFFSGPHLPRTRKHLPDPLKGSAAKRMNMFLRWMVRSDDSGVDFGIWKSFDPATLYLPLDVHTSRVARRLKLLKRKQNDWKAVVELTENLRKIDP
jgi:uncharacterized protein (TIGR02757 family)